MVLDILCTEEAMGEMRGHRRKEKADGQLQVNRRLQPFGPRKRYTC